MSLFPIDATLASKAHKLAKRGIAGKAAAEKLGGGLKAPDANLLANVGRATAEEAEARLVENETRILLALAALHRERRMNGEISSPKAWMLCRPTGLSEGQISRLTRKRLDGPHDGWGAGFRLLSHSRNGHIWLNPSGWAVVHALEAIAAKAIEEANVIKGGEGVTALFGADPAFVGFADRAAARLAPTGFNQGEWRSA